MHNLTNLLAWTAVIGVFISIYMSIINFRDDAEDHMQNRSQENDSIYKAVKAKINKNDN